MPRSIISFGFKVDFKDDFKEETTFRGLSEITGQNSENITRADQDGSTSQHQSEQSRVEGHKIPSVYKTFRLVGESYIHYPSPENRESVEERSWFRLW